MTQASFEEGVREGIRFAMTHVETYTVASKSAPPLTEDHVFGHYVMEMTPPPNLLQGSQYHLDKRVRATTASCLKDRAA